MPKPTNQKQKLIRLLQIFTEKTDADHALNSAELLEELAKYDIYAERKSIYTDVTALNELGYDIEKKGGHNGGYYLASRNLEKYELSLLVNAVSSSKFISLKKSRQLIKKLEGLLSVYEAKELDREVYVNNRIKSDNESIYYVVNDLNSALFNKRKITFKYCEWTVNKTLVERNKGKVYFVSPLALSWEDENYYLVAFDEERESIRHYRVDKIKNLSIIDEPVSDNETVRKFDIGEYSGKTFSMYGGEDETVTLEFPAELAGVCIDRFGKEHTFIPSGDKSTFTVRVPVKVSPQFFGWIAGLSGKVKIKAPNNVLEEYKAFVQNLFDGLEG